MTVRRPRRRMSWMVALAALALTQAGTAQEEPEPRAADRAALAERSLLLAAERVGDAIVVVGERGHVLRSTDQGTTWIQSPVPVDRMLTALHHAPGGRLWATGHDAVILSSDDRGLTWTVRHFAPEEEAPLLDIRFLDPAHGFAVGAYGLCLETTDGGTTWEPREAHPEAPHWYGITRTASGDLVLAGEFGILVRSRDEGTTWDELPSPYSGTFFGAVSLQDTVLVHGLRGNVFRSADAGSTWTASTAPTQAGMLAGRVLTDGRVALVGLAGTILLSDNGGRRFTSLPRDDRRGLADALLLPTGSLLVVGEGGTQRVTPP